jgi:hypothetical protein
MSISDPAQLLLRIPELRTFSEDPKIRRAIESGDSFKVYRALIFARLFGRFPAQRDLLKTLTGQRRLFAKPVYGTPTQRDFKVLSLGFFGKDELESDQSHIASQTLLIANKIPLLPFGAYVVKNTAAHQWQVLAQVPPTVSSWCYTRTLTAILMALVLAAPLLAYQQTHSHDLIILNGFEVPLSVQLDGKNFILAAQGKTTVRLRTGPVKGSASADSAGVIDTFAQTISSSARTSVWNIAGAAPLVRHTFVFPKPAWPDSDQQEAPTVYCGARYIELADIKYLFEEVPATLPLARSQSSTSVQQLSMLRPAGAADLPGIKICSDYAFEHGQEKDIVLALQAQAQLHAWAMPYTRLVIAAASAASNKEAIRVATLVSQAKPGQLDYERLVQQAREDAGHHAELLREYAARAKTQSDSANAQYLYASLFTGAEGLSAMQEASLRFPASTSILRSLVWRKAVHGDYAGANQALAQLRKIAPGDADAMLDTEVKILLAQGRGLEALRLLHAAVRDKLAANRPAHAADFALVAKQIRVDPEFWLKELPAAEKNPDLLDFYRVRAGLRPLQLEMTHSAQVKLALALRNNPAQAIKIAKTLSRPQLSALGLDQLTLLFGEALRIEDATLITLMQGLLPLNKIESQVFRQFVTGAALSLDQFDLDLEIQSAAYFIRSRNNSLSAQERAAWRSQAAKTDLFRGSVSAAISQWPV